MGLSSFAQLEPGFKKEEARDMIAICNSFTFLDLYNSDEEILPPHYTKRYTSGVFGMDNKYQIYQNGDVAVINLRGSTDKKISWLENIYSAMIPAKGIIEIPGEKIEYCFAKDTSAAVHGGYALGIAYISKDILYHINGLHREGIDSFIITGHSQGGALANLLRAYLQNLSPGKIPNAITFKTYAFAAPMVGNKAFAEEYNSRFCVNNTSFNLVNAADPIPQFPLSYNETISITDHLKTLLFDKESFDFKDVLSNRMAILFEDKLINLAQRLSTSASAQIAKDLGPAVMPGYVRDINYQKLGNRVELKPVVYPKMLKDSTILQNDSLMAVYQKGSNGELLNEELYVQEPWAYQHKPYNYYVSFLEMYFPEEYYRLEKKYLPENL